MKKSNEDIIKQYEAASFDSDPLRKTRVYAKAVLAQRTGTGAKCLYATLACFILFAGFFIGVKSDELFSSSKEGLTCSIIETQKQDIIVSASPKPSAAALEDLSEEDCAKINTKYLLAQAASQQSVLLAKAKDCPTKDDPLSGYDSKIIAQMELEMKSYSQEVFSAKDMDKLKVCSNKYNSKVQPVMLYRVAC